MITDILYGRKIIYNYIKRCYVIQILYIIFYNERIFKFVPCAIRTTGRF